MMKQYSLSTLRSLCALMAILFSMVAVHGLAQETGADQDAAKQAPAKQTAQAADETKEAKEKKPELHVNAALHQQTVSRAVKFLLAHQDADGSFSKQLGPAVTAMCVSALIDNGLPISHTRVQSGIKYIETFVQPDGGIYAPNSGLRNYETSVAMMCLIRANVDDKYDVKIQKAVGFLKGIQWDEGEGHDQTSHFYGGQGYGKHKRPDLSNTSFFLDALKAAGEDPKSAAMQKAMKFVSRTQNLNSKHNGMTFSTKTMADDKGGFIYSPVGEGETKAEPLSGTPDGGLRSYASMTYAGLKSLLYAGVAKDDIRVQAAKDWIGRHYSLETNPGMGLQGLFYYYHIFAKTLDASGERLVKDSDGLEHNWRADLINELAKRQRDDGSWTNEADRWYEGDPNLVTSYALLSLAYCHPDKDK